MDTKYSFRLIVPAILFGMVLSVPSFAQDSGAPATSNPNAPAGQQMREAGHEMENAGSDTVAAQGRGRLAGAGTMSNYRIEGGRVAYFDDYYFRKPLPMPQADAASFEPVDRWFARDRNHVYFLYNIVEGAMPASFTVLGGYNDFWAKDAGQAWYFCPSKAAKQF